MFKLFSRKSDHPLADAKELQRIVGEIAQSDPIRALGEVADWVDSLQGADDIELEHRFGVLRQLEDSAQGHLRTATKDLLVATLAGTASAADRRWPLGASLWRKLAAGYAACLDGLESSPSGHREFRKSSLPILCIRQIRAYVQWMKWSQFRYGPVDGEVWQAIGRAYLVMVGLGQDKRRYPALGGTGGEASARDEFCRAVLFHASALDHLRPLEVEIVEKLVTRFCALSSLSEVPEQDSLYWVDPAQSAAPTRVAIAPRPSPTLRFFGAGQIVPQVQAMEEVTRRGDLPPDLNLGTQYPPKLVLAVLEHVTTYWAPTMPTRQHPRHPVRSTAQIVIGFESIHEVLDGLRQPAATWSIENVSRGGLGLQAAPRDEAMFHLGELVAVRPEGGGNWMIGIVKRLSRASDGAIRIGVKSLSSAPVSVRMQIAGEHLTAILLDELETGASVRLALPQYDFEDRAIATLRFSGQLAELQPVGMLESAEGCDLARYRVSQIIPSG